MSELGAVSPVTPTSWWMLMLKIQRVEFRAAEQAMPQKKKQLLFTLALLKNERRELGCKM